MQSNTVRLENGDNLTTYDFGDIRYTVRRKGWEQYYVLSWNTGDQEKPFAAIPYDDMRFLVLAWRAQDSRFHPSQFYVLVGDTLEQVGLDNVNKHMTTQMLASHPIWCPVANMKAEHPSGHGGLVIQRGTSDIAPGAKVYCHLTGQGDGYERLPVTVHHRVSHRLITIFTAAAWLEHWRVELVYEPNLIRKLICHWDWTPESKALAESLIELGTSWAKRKIANEMR